MVIQPMATIKLKHLTIPKLVDAAFMCGKDRQPVFIHIVGDPGIGKTYSTKSIDQIPGVNYFCANFSPNEYKIHVKTVAQHTQLFIHDDIGRCNPSYVPDYISAVCDLSEGHIEYRQFKKNINSDFDFSVVITSTSGWFYRWKDIMTETGYLDRILPIVLVLNSDTEKAYKNACSDDAMQNGCISSEPAQRPLTVFKKHASLGLWNVNVAARNIRNILRLSSYLDEPEMMELIAVIQADKPKYSI